MSDISYRKTVAAAVVGFGMTFPALAQTAVTNRQHLVYYLPKLWK